MAASMARLWRVSTRLCVPPSHLLRPIPRLSTVASIPKRAYSEETHQHGRMMIAFTCNKCNHRSHKFMSKRAYYQGVVVIRCDGCTHLHLIADRLGWFRDGGTDVEQLVKERGGHVEHYSSTTNSHATTERMKQEMKQLGEFEWTPPDKPS